MTSASFNRIGTFSLFKMMCNLTTHTLSISIIKYQVFYFSLNGSIQHSGQSIFANSEFVNYNYG